MLDTNICIYIIKKRPTEVIKKFKTFHIGEICMSSISLAELMYGVEKSQYPKKNSTALGEFKLPLDILPFDEEVTHYYGRVRAYLEKKGTSIGALDLMIAAHALCINSILVTNNIKEFSRVPKLRVENWYIPIAN
ncbi:MAG: type II toxin-antitoxin system VapC family toxin [Rickettsiella sp.]|nr:type II toxin-antitoxin system VapC family toxin [Rickettsiella sp.]